MGKKWHTNKTKPKAYEEILVIEDNCDVYTDMIILDENGKGIGKRKLGNWCGVKYWQYTDKLFKKELQEIITQEEK